jgi:hypothetical protein
MIEQHEVRELLSPAIFQLWEQCAKANKESADNWRDYARMMAAFQEALARAPRTAEECERVEIERLFVSELEHLANLVNAIFPLGGMLEFESYITD